MSPKNKHQNDDETDEQPRTDIPEEAIKDDVVEYFGADGKDEGQKLMQNPDGTWGGDGEAPAP